MPSSSRLVAKWIQLFRPASEVSSSISKAFLSVFPRPVVRSVATQTFTATRHLSQAAFAQQAVRAVAAPTFASSANSLAFRGLRHGIFGATLRSNSSFVALSTLAAAVAAAGLTAFSRSESVHAREPGLNFQQEPLLTNLKNQTNMNLFSSIENVNFENIAASFSNCSSSSNNNNNNNSKAQSSSNNNVSLNDSESDSILYPSPMHSSFSNSGWSTPNCIEEHQHSMHHLSPQTSNVGTSLKAYFKIALISENVRLKRNVESVESENFMLHKFITSLQEKNDRDLRTIEELRQELLFLQRENAELTQEKDQLIHRSRTEHDRLIVSNCHLAQQNRAMQSRHVHMTSAIRCSICLERSSNVVYGDCLHHIVCDECDESRQAFCNRTKTDYLCGLCRTPVTSRIAHYQDLDLRELENQPVVFTV